MKVRHPSATAQAVARSRPCGGASAPGFPQEHLVDDFVFDDVVQDLNAHQSVGPAGWGWSLLPGAEQTTIYHPVMEICWSCNVPGDQSISSAAAARLTGKRILVVEDTWVVAEAMQSLLEEAGLVVAGPSASVAHAERLVSEKVPQLAVVDLKLNGEMAHDLINWLHDRGVSVVVVSALVSKPPAKAAAIVQKPFSGETLIETLCSVVDHSTNS